MLLETLRKPSFISYIRNNAYPDKEGNNRNSIDESDVDFIELASQYGFKKIGIGYRSTVFGNPKYPYVIKLFVRDYGYMKYLKFCMDNKKNPYMPKIRGKVIKINNYMYAVRLEKLIPYGDLPTTDKVKIESLAQMLFDIMEKGKNFDASYQNLIKYTKSNKNLIDIRNVVEFFMNNNLKLDPIVYNFMKRPNGDIVITDPLFGYFKDKKIDPKNLDDIKGIF
jgi:hypothetical protein